MTGLSERIKASHRGFRQAEPASRSRIIALNSFGLRYERIDDFNVLVEGRYQLNLAMSYWRSIDGTSHGYLVSALDAEIKNSEKPAAGRDSVADRSGAALPAYAPAIAESAAPAMDGSASLLPVVTP